MLIFSFSFFRILFHRFVPIWFYDFGFLPMILSSDWDLEFSIFGFSFRSFVILWWLPEVFCYGYLICVLERKGFEKCTTCVRWNAWESIGYWIGPFAPLGLKLEGMMALVQRCIWWNRRDKGIHNYLFHLERLSGNLISSFSLFTYRLLLWRCTW